MNAMLQGQWGGLCLPLIDQANPFIKILACLSNGPVRAASTKIKQVGMKHPHPCPALGHAQEFIVVFAKMASKLVEKAMSESGTFIQEAVQTQTKFPEVGSAAVVKKFHKNFELRLSSRKPKAQKAPKPSLLETRRERRGDDDKPEGGLGFGAADYVPQEHKLITQFNGVETDSGSCLAFAPSVRGGPGNTVEPRDWQTPGRQSDNVPSEFVKLEPWAVPCANSWMKDNPSKWQGYSFYTWETPLERCATVVYSLGLQPVLAFVGGLEFDMMPSPIAEAPLTIVVFTCPKIHYDFFDTT